MSYEGITVLNYRLGRKLGEGGFGVVYAAEHVQLGRAAAVKVLHRDYSKHSELTDRFFREARLVCDIGHDAIVQVHNAGTLDSGEPFYLMELVEGTALDETVVADGPLSAVEAEAVFGPIAEALAAAHARGVIHRDLKPSNIMLRRDGDRVVEVKLLDFGIAKLLDAVDDLSSSTGRMMGTPAYMAPEQARDAKNVDARADVYSFAATVFSALSGRKLYEKTNVAELLLAVQTQPAPRLASILDGVPRRLDRAIARCLDKNRDARPDSIEQAWAEIRAGLTAAKSMAPRAVATADTLQPPGLAPLASTLTEAASSHAPTEVRRRGPAMWMIGAVVAVATAGAYVAATSLASEPGSSAVATRLVDAGPPDATGATPWMIADAAPPDALPPPDAAPPDAAPKPRSSRRRHLRRPPKPRPDAAPPPEPKPLPPSINCSTASFAKVWQAADPPGNDVHAALARLRRCREAGQLDATRFQQYQRALLRKL